MIKAIEIVKKVIIMVLVAVNTIGHALYAPQIKEENIAVNATVNEEAVNVTSDAPLTYWKAKAGDEAVIDFGKEVTFNTVELTEVGDNVRIFRFYKLVNGEWEMFYEQDRIAGYRMCTFETTTTSKLKIEIAECDDTVKLSKLAVYNRAKSDREIKVSQYLVMDNEGEMAALRDSHDEGFSGYYDVVTDVIVFRSIFIDENANVCFVNGEEAFAENLQALRDIIGDRNVRIWVGVDFDRPATETETTLDATSKFVNNHCGEMVNNIANVVEKYDLYGIDYDWEYPQERNQWKSYSQLVTESAERFKVSVALPPWGVGFSLKAKQAIEHVNVMAYDLFDDRGDHANIQKGTIDSTQKLVLMGFKKSQLLMGIPTYGRTVDGSGYSWPVARGNEEELGKFNSIVKDNTFTDSDGVTHTYDAYVQSYAEARDKTAYAESAGLGGIMIFRAKCDSPYTYEYSIHRAIKDAIDN